MLLKFDQRIGALLLLVACSCSTLACAKPAPVCPKRDQVIVQQIDIFDGKPEDQAYLAPDDPEKAPNTYTVGGIYDQGRTVTVRCHYGDGHVRDVELKQRKNKCRYSTDKKHSANLVCR